jgi:hypothetical protein
MDVMNEMQQYLVEDHIHGLEVEAARLRAERARDHRAADATSAGAITAAVPAATAPLASAAFALAPVTIDPVPSPRVRLGRWLVGVGAAIAGANEEIAVRPSAAIKSANGPCDDGSSRLSHAA